MANGVYTKLVNQIRDKERMWPPAWPKATHVLIHETVLPDDFDYESEKLDGYFVVPTTRTRYRNSVHLIIAHEQLG